MRKYARDRRPDVKPVEHVELDTRHVGLRLFLVIILLLIGAAALGYGITHLLSSKAGWEEIKADTKEKTSAGDFTFVYELGADGQDPTAERKALTIVYTDLARDAYRRYTTDEEFDGFVNMATMNARPRERLTVDASLYRALQKVTAGGSRWLYMAPVYATYEYALRAEDDTTADFYDPHVNEEVHQDFLDLLKFIESPDAVNLELLDNDQVILHVSDEYMAYQKGSGRNLYVDFSWMKDAYIADEIAEGLSDAGYQHGTLSSVDGFGVNLDPDAHAEVNIVGLTDGEPAQVAVMSYSGCRSIVSLRRFALGSQDPWHYRTESGEYRNIFLSMSDGLDHTACDALIAYSSQLSCGDILMKLIRMYIQDTIPEVRDGDPQYVIVDGDSLYYTDPEFDLALKQDGLTARKIS